MRVLVVNNGSSSYKLALVEIAEAINSTPKVIAKDAGKLGYHAPDDELHGILQSKIKKLLASADSKSIDAIGHRIVHGGELYKYAVLVDEEVERNIERLSKFAPLHNPQGLISIKACRAIFADVPQIAVFDTAFHSTMPAESYTYPIPQEWRDELGIRRFGFHGISHSYCSRKAAEILRIDPKALNIVNCHLGSGCSLAAIAGGASIDTTMGFTPLEGLMMSTRSGSIDPGILLYLIRTEKHDPAKVEQALNTLSGFKGLCGTPDMVEVRKAAVAGDPNAKLAIEVFIHRVAQGIAAMAVSLGRVDAISFAGGVGENDSITRKQVCNSLSLLGIEVDDARNDKAEGDAIISSSGSRSQVLVIESREDLQIAKESAAVLTQIGVKN